MNSQINEERDNDKQGINAWFSMRPWYSRDGGVVLTEEYPFKDEASQISVNIPSNEVNGKRERGEDIQ